MRDAARAPDRPVLFLYFHAMMGDTFRSAVQFAGCSGDLKAQGIPSEVVEVYLEHRDPPRNAATVQELRALIEARRPGVVVLHEVPTADLFQVVRDAARPATVVLVDAFSRFPAGTVDVVVRHFNTNPGVASRLVRTLRDGGDPSGLPNLLFPEGDGFRASDAVVPRCDGMLHEAPPDVDRTFLPDGYRPPAFRVTAYVNPGCPHGEASACNPEYATVDLSDPAISGRGCSFCHMGGDYRGLPRDATVARIVGEFRAYRERWPEVRELILRDQQPYRYLAALVTRLRDEGVTPASVLFSARADLLVRFRAQVEEACRACEGSGIDLNLYLVGFENFSPPELLRLNKGATSEQMVDAIRIAREFADRFPRAFVYDRYRTSSFILFTPWTTLDDLRRNVQGFRANDITEFSTGMGQSKLRLYPNLPIYHKAATDGLLIGDYADRDRALDGARRFGYSFEHPWRFRDGRADAVYRLYVDLYPLVSRSSEVALLDWLVGWAEAGGADPDGVRAAFRRMAREIPDRLRGPRPAVPPGGPSPSQVEPRRTTAELRLGAGCNNGCRPCSRDVEVLDPSPERLRARLEEWGRTARRLVIEGREPTLSPLFLDAVRTARACGFQEVDVLTNGRMFAYKAFLVRAVRAGLTSARVKIFAGDEAGHFARTRVPRGHGELAQGLANLREVSSILRPSGVVVAGQDTVGGLDGVVAFARRAGLSDLSYLVPIQGLPRDGLDRFVDALEAHLDRTRSAGVRFSFDGL